MKQIVITFLLLAASWSVHAEDGMKDRVSKFGFQETQSRLEAAIKEKGLMQFAKIDHAEGAKQFGLEMLPAIVTIFGHPKGGTPVMVAAPKSAIDFPLKAIVWVDASGKVMLSYNSMDYVVNRHHIQGQDELAKKLGNLLEALSKAATE